MTPEAVKMARFFSAFFRGFTVTSILSAFVALNVHYGAGLGEVLIPWFKVGVILGIAYAYITYLEFTTNKTKKGLSPWAAERVAQFLAPWLFLDLVLLFGIAIPFGGYIVGITYNGYGLLSSLLVMVSVSAFAGIVRGLIYARIGLPENPWFVYLKIAEKLYMRGRQ
jgi:hypothetical protein